MFGSADGRRRIANRQSPIANLMGHRHGCGVSFEPGSQPGSQPGRTMADKSPRQHMSKQAGKSLKEKRAEKHAKADGSNKIEIVPPGKKH